VVDGNLKKLLVLSELAKLLKTLLASCLSEWNGSGPIGQIFMKFCIWGFFRNLSWYVCPLTKLSSHWTDFYENCYLRIFQKSVVTCLSVDKTQLSLDGFLWKLLFEDFSETCRDMSVRWQNSALIGRIFMKIAIWGFFRNLSWHVCPLTKLSSHWTDFYENCYLRIFHKSVGKINFSFKFDKNGYRTERHTFILKKLA